MSHLSWPAFGLFLTFHLVVPLGFANGSDGCHISALLSPTFNDAEFYSDQSWNNILFISDGLENPIGNRVAQMFPNKKVTSTDTRYKNSKNGEHAQIKHDNNEPFPLKDNSQDVIVMSKGICCCSQSEISCGGLVPGSDNSVRFFSEVIRMLNKHNKEATAFIHGYVGNQGSKGKLWHHDAQRALRRMKAAAKVKVSVQRNSDGGFSGLLFLVDERRR